MRSSKVLFFILLGLLPFCTVIGADNFSVHLDSESSHRFFVYRGSEKLATVEKNKWGVRTHYSVLNGWGPFGLGTTRAMSWGAFKSGWKVIDVYDVLWGGYHGNISGLSAEGYAARFGFYDKDGKLYGIANVDPDNGVIDVFKTGKASTEKHMEFFGHENPDGQLTWNFTLHNGWLSEQVIHVFAAFMQDYYPPTKAWEEDSTSLER